MRLKDKVIIVTGSTTGVGEAMVRRYVAEGARVVVHGLERELGEKVVASLGSAAVLHVDDLSDPAAADRLVGIAVKLFGKLDGIVNNAAAIVRSNLQTTDAALFDRVMNVNLRAPLLLVRSAIEHLKKTEGAVLNIGSINGYCGETNQLAYSLSKGALVTLTRNLADTFGPDRVRFNQLTLGWVLSENEIKLKIREGMAPDWYEKPPKAFAPSGKIMLPAQIAHASVYWMSDESRPVSGSIVELEQYPMVGRNPIKG